MAYVVYVLVSEKTGRRYTGSCADLKDRLRRHNLGYSKATRHGIPWRLIYSEEFATRPEAVQRELHLKTGAGRDELDSVLSRRLAAATGGSAIEPAY